MKTIALWLEFRFNLFHVPFEDFGNTKLSLCHLRTSFNEMFLWVKMPPKLVKSADRDQNIITWSGYSSIWYLRPFPHAFSRKYPKTLNLTRFTWFLAATKQLYEWFSPSVCLSVCLSVCDAFSTMFPSSYHHEIFRGYYQWQKWCKRSRSEVKGQGHRGQNPT